MHTDIRTIYETTVANIKNNMNNTIKNVNHKW